VNFLIRPGTLDDIETIVGHRRAMFHEMGNRDEAALDRVCTGFRPWLARKMQVGEYLAWFAVGEDEKIAAGLGLWLMDWPPHILGPGRWRANILNVYTQPQRRCNGLARALVEQALEWCRANNVSTIILHASDAGRPLYQSIGFLPSPEMRLILKLD
jgi:GNAT superfamily N-acetyltransferase